jgi:hypothetical protein
VTGGTTTESFSAKTEEVHMPKTPGQTFIDEQIALIAAGDVDGLVARHYRTDATLVRFDGVVQGHAALAPFFRAYIESLGSLRLLSMDQFVETQDSIFFEATIETARFGVVRVYDAFLLREGKATHHFTGSK